MSVLELATLALVVVTTIYVIIVGRQIRQSEKNILRLIRSRLESDVTQIRTTGALILGKAAGWEKLEAREKQYKKTIPEVTKQLEQLEKGFKLTDVFKGIVGQRALDKGR